MARSSRYGNVRAGDFRLGAVGGSITSNDDRTIVIDIVHISGFEDRALSLDLRGTTFDDRSLSIELERLVHDDRTLVIETERVEFSDRNLSVELEALAFNDRGLSIELEKVEHDDRNLSIDIDYGSANSYSIYVDDSLSTEHNLSRKMFVHQVVKRKNSVYNGKIVFRGLTDSEKSDIVRQGNSFKYFAGHTLILKGVFEEVEYTSLTETTCTIRGIASSRLINRVTDRIEFSNAPNTSVFSDFLAGTGVSVGTNETYGSISLRSEFGNIWNAEAQLADQTQFDFWEDWGAYPYNGIRLNQASRKGSVIPKMTLKKAGLGANVIVSSKKPDRSNQINHVIILGYGDGINQIKSENWHATSKRTQLNGSLSKTATTINVDSTSMFPSSGRIRIGKEVVSYTGKNATQFTGCTRGANDENGFPTQAYAHDDNIEAYLYYDGVTFYTPENAANAENGSSIKSYGLIQKALSRREIIDQNALDRIAQRIISKFREPLERITIQPAHPKNVLDVNAVDVGDTITAIDESAGLNGDYEIAGLFIGTNDKGIEELKIELAFKNPLLLEEIDTTKAAVETEASYMQGATNIYCVSTYENTSVGFPLHLRFFIPPEAIAINAVKINFRLKNYRAYESSNAATLIDHTHSIPSLTVNSFTTPAGGTIFSANAIDLIQESRDFSEPIFVFADMPTVVLTSFHSNIYNYGIFNQSGGTRTYNWSVKDGGTTLYSGSFSLANFNAQTRTEVDAGTDRSGHSIRFEHDQSWNSGGYDQMFLRLFTTSNHTHTVTGATTVANTSASGGGSHTHSINYGIFEQSLTSPSVTVKTGLDGGGLTTVGAFTSDQINLDITSIVQGVGANNWIDVEFTPNKNMRIEANAYVQIFIQSTV